MTLLLTQVSFQESKMAGNVIQESSYPLQSASCAQYDLVTGLLQIKNRKNWVKLDWLLIFADWTEIVPCYNSYLLT